MRVLQINTVCSLGSTGRITVDIAKELNCIGHECKVIYGQYFSNYEEAIYIGNRLENHLHNLGSRLFDKQGMFSVGNTKRCLHFIEKFNPDIIHLHNLHGNYMNIKLLFDFLSDVNIPIVWTFHDCWPFTGHCAYFDYIDCKKWKTGCYDCENKRSYPPSWFLDNSVANYQCKKYLFNKIKKMEIVSPSLWLAGLVKESFLSKYPVSVIHNGLDIDYFSPRTTLFRKKMGWDNKIMLLGVAMGGFTGRKGLAYFLELAKLLPDYYVIVLVGVTKAEKHFLPPRIIGIEQTNNLSELVELYSCADIFLNPTLEDNFPTTNIEALSCGTPVITFDTGGSSEAIDYQTGMVVPKGDLKELVNSILQMNVSFKIAHGADCRERAITMFDKKCAIESYVHLYYNILSK